jgi:hypothetical protein
MLAATAADDKHLHPPKSNCVWELRAEELSAGNRVYL